MQAVAFIVDFDDRRAKRIGKSLSRSGAQVYLYCKEGRLFSQVTQEGVVWLGCSFPAECDLAVVHHTHEVYWKELHITPNAVVRYTGDYSEFRHGWIQRSVTKAYGLPTIEEAGELLEWSLQSPEQRAKWLPSLLVPTRSPDNLSALAILCQGYLAAHFPEPSKASGPVKEALDRMRWTELAKTDEGKAFAEKAADNALKTNGPKWWHEVFGMSKDELLKKLEEECRAEKLPEEISGLVTAFYDTDLSKKAELIAGAYLKFEEELKERML